MVSCPHLSPHNYQRPGLRMRLVFQTLPTGGLSYSLVFTCAQLPFYYILCTADNLIPCSLEKKYEVSSCSGSLYVYNIPRSYHLAELFQALIVCYERTRQLLGSTECVLGSLLIELPGGGPSLASLPGRLTSLAYLAGSPP